jgi:hypothetical protein
MSVSDVWVQRANVDLQSAVAEGDFAVETPTTYVAQDEMNSLHVGIQHHETGWLRKTTYNTIEVTIDCTNVEFVKDCTERELDIVLHGYQHLWSAERFEGYDATIDTDGETMFCNVGLSILDVEEAGWKRP